jgi:hypothetical protein
VISVAVFWLCGRPLQELYEEFEFVDRILRDLIGIQREVLREVPELAQAAAPKLEQEIGSPHLWFRSEKRSCEVLYYGKNDHPDFFFHWDSTEMFRLRTRDASVFAPLLRRWFVDSAVPSALKKDYPQIELHRVASYYEEGRPVEGEFICSWDWIERFYRVELAKNWKHSSRMVALLEEMRAAGFDKSLRAGQSLYTLMLSRSRRHGLRSEQPWVAIDIGQEGMKVTANLPKQEEVVSKGVVLTPALQRLLSQLESQPIS